MIKESIISKNNSLWNYPDQLALDRARRHMEQRKNLVGEEKRLQGPKNVGYNAEFL